jgi:hypothetical protein
MQSRRARTSAAQAGQAACPPRPCDNSHASTAKFLDDVVVRDGLPDERVGAGHIAAILRGGSNQVNEAESRVKLPSAR